MLRTLGFDVQLRLPVDSPRSYLAGTDESRAERLAEALSDPTVDAVWCLRGGYGCVRTLEAMNLDAWTGPPRALIGFSDVTGLLVASAQRLGVVAFHAPVVTQLPEVDERSRRHTLDLLAGRTDRIPLADDRRVLRGGRAEGRLVGGNLSVLCSLLQTPWQANLDGSLLFIEDVGEPPYRLDRMLTQLRLAGALTGVKGLLCGRFTGVRQQARADLDAVLEETASWIDGPVVRGLPIGHLTENVAVPLGVRARLVAGADHVQLLEPAVRSAP